MIWVLLSIMCVLGIFILFKVIDRTSSPLINSIVVNYLVAAVLGFSISSFSSFTQIIYSNWIYSALVIGLLFVLGFYVLGKSSEKVGMSITTVISKMAVIIPIIFSIIAYKEEVNFLKILAVILTIVAIVMCIYKKTETNRNISFKDAIIPILLFLIMGSVDASIIYAKENYVDNSISSIFSACLFAIAFLLGFVFSLLNIKSIKGYFNYKTWLWGGLLGLINFASIYFILKALNSCVFPNSILYGIVNISVVCLSLLVGLLFFKEKLTRLNFSGVILAIFTVILLTYIEM